MNLTKFEFIELHRKVYCKDMTFYLEQLKNCIEEGTVEEYEANIKLFLESYRNAVLSTAYDVLVDD